MIIHNVLQGTDEWLQLRSGVATASNFDKIITSTGKESATLPKYALELASQRLTKTQELTYKSEAMERGNELEPEARIAYIQQTFNIVDEVGFITTDCGNIGYSPDGLVEDDGIIEIKCPLATTHAKYLFDNKVPSEYWQQIQGGLFVSERKWCDFISYHPDFLEKELFVIRVERDNEYIDKLAEFLKKTILLRNEILEKINN